MSSRVLKKLQQGGGNEKELELPDDGIDEDQASEEEDDEDSMRGSRGKHLNPFDLLNQQSFSESEVKEDDNETEHASTAANLPGAATACKKKKKKRKKKSRYTGNHISSEDNDLTDKYISDMDSLILKDCDGSNQNAKHTTPRIEIDKSLMLVELKHLNPHNEMRRTFGKRVVKIENKRGRQKLTLKSTYMVTAKEFWPPVTKNIITMKPTAAPDSAAGTSSSAAHSTSHGNLHWFAFEHSQYYQGVQNMFLPAVERTDSEFLINLIRRCPYHVDSLIQLSELCKMTEDYSLATELIERAVLVLELALHPSFSLISGNCRLDYRRQENRAFFIVLFKHALYLEARACTRTAFEISKLILSLSPDNDPLAMVLVIDYYALRCKQFSWLIKFYEEYDSVRNLSQLPNMAYSYALSLFCILGECEKSDKALQYALLMFPGVLRPLLDEMSVQTDKRVLASDYFNSTVSGSLPPALHQLYCLYVCRAKVVWRQKQILPWIERNVNEVLDRIEQKDAIIADYSVKRQFRYITPPRAILRHVILSDYKEKVPLATFVSNEKFALVAYDPLPPSDSVNCYERKSSSSSPTTATARPVSMFFQSLFPTFNLNNAVIDPQHNIANAIANAAENAGDAAAANPRNADFREEAALDAQLMAVNRQFQALQNNDAPAEAAGAEAANAAGLAEGGNAAPIQELSQHLGHIVDAMRDFINNFRAGEQMNADGDENGSSEEDTSDYFD